MFMGNRNLEYINGTETFLFLYSFPSNFMFITQNPLFDDENDVKGIDNWSIVGKILIFSLSAKS